MAMVESSKQEQEKNQVPGPSRSRLVQRLLDASANLPAFINDLLGTMAVVVAGTEAAGFLLEQQPDGKVGMRPIAHIRPDESDSNTRAAAIKAFQDIVQPCVVQGKDGAIEVGSPDGGEPQFCLVTLLRAEGQVVAVAAVITRCRDQERARQRLTSMQLVGGYFELYTLRQRVDHSQLIAQNHQQVLQLAGAVATAEGFESAARAICNEMAVRAGASRVSMGWVKGNKVKLKALSHTEKFDKKQEMVIALQKVMEECYDQEEPVRYEVDGTRSQNVTRAAEQFSRQHGGNSILSLPLRKGPDIIAVLTAEFPPNRKIDDNLMTGLAVSADILAPQMADRYDNDRWLITKAGVSTVKVAKMAGGQKYWLAKTIILLVLAIGIFINVYSPVYSVSAPFELVPIEKRVISAPFDGAIARVHVQPGDAVTAGTVLLEMRTDELYTRLAEALARASQAQKEADKYRTDKTRIADFQIALQQKEAAMAEAKRYQYDIDHAKIVAPVDGRVIRDMELKDRRDATVKLGEPLMEVAKDNELRAQIAVSDTDIQLVKQEQSGYVATSSLPDKKFKITVDRIVPLGEAKEGANVFTVYANLNDVSETWMRPGMRGEAKIQIGERTLFWWWTHKPVDWLKLKLWSWF